MTRALMQLALILALPGLLYCESDLLPHQFPPGTEKRGPVTDRDLSNCFEYFSGQEKIGREEYYFQLGKIKKQTLFKNGMKHGDEKTWYENGHLQSIVPYVDGSIDGNWREWTDDEYLEGNSKFSHGSGIRTVYYKNGSIKLSEEYKDNKQDGFRRKFYENGKMSSVVNMSHGNLADVGIGLSTDGSIEFYEQFGSHGQLNGYLITCKDHNNPVVDWYADGVRIWSSASGDPPPGSLKDKNLDPKKVYSALVIPPEYLDTTSPTRKVQSKP